MKGDPKTYGFAGRLAALFVDSKLTPLAVIASILLGVFAVWMLPREEWGPYENAAPIDRLDLDREVARWTGVRTAGQLVPEGAGS